MAGVLPIPSGTIKHAYRMSRLVVLPDSQGLGIGTKINEFIAQYYIEHGYRFYIRTSHVRMFRHLKNSKLWVESSSSGKVSSPNGGEMKMNYDTKRVCYSFEYLGKEYASKPLRIVRVQSVNNMNKFKQDIERLREKYFITIVTGSSVGNNEIEKLAMSLGIRTESLYMSNEEIYNNKNELRYSEIKFYDESIDIFEQYDEKNYNRISGQQFNDIVNSISENKVDNSIYNVKNINTNYRKTSLIDLF